MTESIRKYIPIQNLYYLLCYAWDLAEQRDKLKVDAEHCDTYPDLFAMLLVSGCHRLFKYGLYHEYENIEDERYGVKGKLDVSKTIKMGRWEEGKMFCAYDEYSQDVLLNQIIRATLLRLVRCDELDDSIHDDVVKVYLQFPLVKEISLKREDFFSVKITRNNRFYGLLLHICLLIFESLIPDKSRKGMYRFLDFSEDKMNRIFERFLFNFYRKECNADYPNVDRSHIDFQLTPWDEQTGNHLPTMITDVTLTNRKTKRKIILDAKYYFQTLVARPEEGSKENIRREHLSQIISYVLNQEDEKTPYTFNTNGILVYPKVQSPLFDTYRYRDSQHFIRVCTVDLNEDWQKIDKRLKEIIQF